ncbi:HlyD family secretion protein [Thiomicrorhabdus sp. Milos-T2]|uniref:HlyD family secretion protein n=1 Tax=Thiomicrorhabdus sp. Milos-T2 TaxID=90814 RepID=UPI000494D955|nr:efflux RND transporter periplasmic adaptor subunit [Thiomicrorhabdus sp. Milos-T2]
MTPKLKVRLVFLVLLSIFIGASYFYFQKQANGLSDDVVKLNGRTEADNYLASTKVAGKVIDLKVREGDEVKEGQVLVVLDDAQVRAQVAQAKAAYNATQAQLKAVEMNFQVLKKQVPLQIETAESAVVYAQAVLKSAIENASQAKLDSQRYKRLYEKGTIQKHQYEAALLAKKVAQNDVTIARAALDQAQKALNETQLGWDQVEAKQQDVNTVQSQVIQAKAALTEANSVLDDMTIKSPTAGVITTRLVNKGEVVASGSGLFNIVNLNEVYLKGYIAEGKLGLVHLNQKAEIVIDSLPDVKFPATIRYIASQTEFTPKEVQTKDERVKLVYAIKFYLDKNPKHRVTPGLPADAYIQVK